MTPEERNEIAGLIKFEIHQREQEIFWENWKKSNKDMEIVAISLISGFIGFMICLIGLVVILK